MALSTTAAGYPGVDGYFTPPQLTGEIVYAYHQCALTPALAKSDFLSDVDLVCGSRAIFGREQELEWFGYDCDNNEDPPVSFGPRVEPDALVICRKSKFQIKLSDLDKRIMCDNYNKWIELLTRQIDKNIINEIDGYSIPLILASAHSDNVGKRAGMLNHTVDLGGQGGTGNEPLDVNTVDEFRRMLDNLIEVASQAGWSCDRAESAMAGDSVPNPVLVIPSKLRGIAKRYVRENEHGAMAGADSSFRNGLIGRLDNIDIICTQRLQPAALSAGKLLMPVVLLDPDQVLHAFDIIDNKVWEDKFDKYFVGQYVYDTSVINPYGVIVANAAVNV